MLDVSDTHRPGSDRSADLNFASTGDSKVLKLLRREVGSGNEERHLDGVILRAKEVVPAEVSHEVSASCTTISRAKDRERAHR